MKSKKILIIGLTERMGGVETFIYNTTRFSDKNKYTYEYLIHGTESPIYEKELTDFYGTNPFHYVGHFKKKPISTFIQLAKFYKKNKNRFDYIHLQTGAASELSYVFPFSLLYTIPLISHSHNGNGYSPLVNALFRGILNLCTSKRLSCSDEATRWLFGKKYIGQTKIINNGIDTAKFTFSQDKRVEIRNQYDINDDIFVIGHIGRFSEQKNHKKIISIFNKVKQLNPNTKLLLVGTGELQDEIKGSLPDSLIDFVIFAGKQADTEAYYSAFDVFLMPSLYEGLPIVGVEAQSMGLPCFFSNTIDSQIILTDNAFVLELNESDDYWAENILLTNIKKDRMQYPEVIKKKSFSIQKTIKELEEIYEV
ncbi:glycosyltransferase [Streptococcus suis]|nr:glycosyltransferase [Streptococcus suis]